MKNHATTISRARSDETSGRSSHEATVIFVIWLGCTDKIIVALPE